MNIIEEKMVRIICDNCEKIKMKAMPNARFCSSDCASKYYRRRSKKKEKSQSKPKESEVEE